MRFLIIGDGVAGHTAAVELREKRPEAEITIVSDEQYPFYDRVALKRMVAGQAEKEEMIKADQDFYSSQEIELMLKARAETVNPERKQVVVSKMGEGSEETESISYDQAINCGRRPSQALGCRRSGQQQCLLPLEFRGRAPARSVLRGE